MNIFESILQEVLNGKKFSTIGELKETIKTILNNHSKLILKDDSPEFKKFGFTFKTYKREFRIIILGDDGHTLISEFKKSGIECRYYSASNTITIKYEDNVSLSGLLSIEAQDEIENSTYGLIGYVTEDKEYPQFFEEQQQIYDELMRNKLISWKFDGSNYILQLK